MPMALPQTSWVVCLPIQYSSWEICKVLSSFPTLSTFLLLIGAPGKRLPSSVITGLQRLIIPGWCVTWSKMQWGGHKTSWNPFHSSQNIPKDYFLPLHPLPLLRFPGLCNPRQSSMTGKRSHLTQWSSYFNCKSWGFLSGKQTNPCEDPSTAKKSNCVKGSTVTASF